MSLLAATVCSSSGRPLQRPLPCSRGLTDRQARSSAPVSLGVWRSQGFELAGTLRAPYHSCAPADTHTTPDRRLSRRVQAAGARCRAAGRHRRSLAAAASGSGDGGEQPANFGPDAPGGGEASSSGASIPDALPVFSEGSDWRTFRAQLVASARAAEGGGEAAAARADDAWAHRLPAPEQGCLLLANPIMFMVRPPAAGCCRGAAYRDLSARLADCPPRSHASPSRATDRILSCACLATTPLFWYRRTRSSTFG